jgi:hypothetical protein
MDERRWQSMIKTHGSTKRSGVIISGSYIAESSRWII